MYELDGMEFSSIKELSVYSGVHEKTITARLRRNMSVKEACINKDFRCNYMPYKNSEQSICQICDTEEKPQELVYNRLRYGYSLTDALNKPKKISRQGKPIIVNGILYKSISAACRRLGIEDKESTVRGRLRAGKNPNDAFLFD